MRSATSIGANVIEAQAASSRKDYINFFNYALKSANECKFWFGLLRDSGRGGKEAVNKLLKEHGDCQYPCHQYIDLERKEMKHFCVFIFKF